MTNLNSRLLERLSARKAAFYFVERHDNAYNGSLELASVVARWLGSTTFPIGSPPILPVWQGTHLPYESAMKRWATPDVWAVIVGLPNAERRRSLVKTIRDRPPLGMFDLDADADRLQIPLVLTWFVIPDALVRLTTQGRYVLRDTGLDVIGFAGDEEQSTFAISESDPYDILDDALLDILSKGAGRRLPGVHGHDGFEAVLDHAYELFGMGAVAPAGVVAGVAFEQLMRAGLDSAGRSWLQQRESAGNNVSLNDLIGKVASAGGWDNSRLHAYRKLRNDVAHRLGDDAAAQRNGGDLREAVYGFLGWLAGQEIDEHGVARLKDVPPDVALTYEELLTSAVAAGDAAAAAERTTQFLVSGEEIEAFGHAWVIVNDSSRPFTRWLLEQDPTRSTERGARIPAPTLSWERNLAWAHACAERLRRAGHSADYAGRPD